MALKFPIVLGMEVGNSDSTELGDGNLLSDVDGEIDVMAPGSVIITRNV
jgi:hypothetical protein